MEAIHPRLRREPVKVIDGHKFYEIHQADEILYQRYMEAEIQELYIRMGISEDFLDNMMSELIDRAMSINDIKQLKQDCIAIGQNIKGRIKRIAEMQHYEDLACVYFMMDDEPIEMDVEFQKKKKEVWRRDEANRDFFITKAFAYINNSADISNSDILAVFQAVKERQSQLPTLD
jgi:hypothetical protein